MKRLSIFADLRSKYFATKNAALESPDFARVRQGAKVASSYIHLQFGVVRDVVDLLGLE